MIPNDKETLLLLYGKNRNDHNMSVQSMRYLSPHQQALWDSVSSKENLFENENNLRKRRFDSLSNLSSFQPRFQDHGEGSQHQMFNSPNMRESINAFSPNMNSDNYRIMSEGRNSAEERKDSSNIETGERQKTSQS